MWAYQWAIILWEYIICLAAPWHSGAKGRRQMIQDPWPAVPSNQTCIWFHCASLGEYEQILPLIEIWELRHPSHRILISFYSNSGYKMVKPNSGNRFVVGFPGDIRKPILQFLSHFNPAMAIFTKAEIWPLCLDVLNEKGIPSTLLAFRAGRSKRLKHWTARFLIQRMQHLALISCQDQASADFLRQLGLTKVSVEGDPRVARTLDLQNHPLNWPEHIALESGKQLIVLGSIWPADLRIWSEIILERSDLLWAIAPHQLQSQFMESLQGLFPQAQRWTQPGPHTKSNIILIDTIGVLSRLYSKAQAAYVGGGFGRGIHSSLEPAAAGIPISFGPNCTHSREAQAFLRMQAGSILNSKQEAQRWLQHVLQADAQQHIKQQLSGWFQQEAEAPEKLMQQLESIFPSHTVS